MTSEQLQTVLEQNRENLSALLTALDTDHELPPNPEKQAKMAAAFGGEKDVKKAAEAANMSDAERAAWLFEENAKALAAAAEAVNSREATRTDVAEDGGLNAVAEALGGRR
jgi:acyl-CoA reductase-like NAD-dependent aldehyde dehydrogenase